MTKEQAIEKIHEALHEIECVITDYPELLPMMERAYEAMPIFTDPEL